ncbi:MULTISPECIES: hypothetical protein [Allobranchiibius]|uniref:Uncharacterized protein n=1 Tax=Allobranchiibius huperziae TaxID=1874116 RepID=A0A853DDT6_9MICO|nr:MULTISPECIES: hypothetical protein [Allobranchiibius]MBO1766875.1 hypothetical protein [Allobranchiibius sp. GilTou38]NYJ75038.1 hypothetical protein [Allobranchiibius huperziae]
MSAPGSESHDEQTDYDARFAEIVAQLSGTVDPDALAEPEVEEPEPQPPAPPALPVQWRVPDSGAANDILEDDGTYEPPPPAPLPRDDVQFWAIWASLVGGPLWLIYLFAFERDCQPIWWVLACLVCILGVVLLVLRQPNSRDDQDPFDDGARL